MNRVQTKNLAESDWRLIVDRMKDRGAELSDEDVSTLIGVSREDVRAETIACRKEKHRDIKLCLCVSVCLCLLILIVSPERSGLNFRQQNQN
jgi:hypothetical protein